MANEHVNKVTLGSETLIDITDTTAETSDVASGEVFYAASGARSVGTAAYASAPIANGNADRANAILYGTVDSTSTSTAFTATVAGLTRIVDGTCVMLRNGIVTSASGFTLNVNGLGDKPVYNNLATGNDITPTKPTRDTTIFNINYTMLFVYDSQLVDGGAWICYRGYDANTNTIGYQLRTNNGNKTAADTGYRYRLWFTSADGSKWVPANTSSATNSTSNRSLNTRAIDPFGPIVYRSTNGTCTSGSGIGATGIWQQYNLAVGYSYMASGFVLTFPAPVYLRCTPQTDGSATMNDIVQALPSTNDGKIYVHLGTAYSGTMMELSIEHPVYWHDGTGIRLWTGAEPVTDAGVTSFNGATGAVTYTAPVTSVNGSTGAVTGLATTAQVSAKQDALVSGTNIKTINGESLLGSGNITAGGATYIAQGVGIPTSAWSGTTATVSVAGVAVFSDVIVAPALASIAAWAAAGVYCSALDRGTLTFTCSTVPTAALTANILILG